MAITVRYYGIKILANDLVPKSQRWAPRTRTIHKRGRHCSSSTTLKCTFLRVDRTRLGTLVPITNSSKRIAYSLSNCSSKKIVLR